MIRGHIGRSASLGKAFAPLIPSPTAFGRDAVGRPWRIALTTPSLDGLRAAVQAGLGITCRTELGLGLPPLPDNALPQLPEISYSVIERRRDKTGPHQVAQRMAEHLAELTNS
ncbi:hypothetical protein [Roseibium algae]|uniref:LysR substrate binding domain-containing protein n=1 Tax=Roseibium algae TaxID=3123038 RepID=A0ABU8TID7_9HYPH